jgi:16S rRNA (uracil1498-N3)-methyltransferase
VERDNRGQVATFFTDGPFGAGSTAELGESVAHHVRVKRLQPGDHIRLTDGVGQVGVATISALGRKSLTVDVADVSMVPRPPDIHLRAPVADRDRMLWLAEKATELGIASWQAVRFRRSASVSPRGEGDSFHAKVRARMIGAVEQSGGAWVPSILPDASIDDLDVAPRELAVVLDRDGVPLASLVNLPSAGSPVILLGPEGGFETEEIARLDAAGWQRASLAKTMLRFETAGIAAIAVCRALRGLTAG